MQKHGQRIDVRMCVRYTVCHISFDQEICSVSWYGSFLALSLGSFLALSLSLSPSPSSHFTPQYAMYILTVLQ